MRGKKQARRAARKAWRPGKLAWGVDLRNPFRPGSEPSLLFLEEWSRLDEAWRRRSRKRYTGPPPATKPGSAWAPCGAAACRVMVPAASAIPASRSSTVGTISSEHRQR